MILIEHLDAFRTYRSLKRKLAEFSNQTPSEPDLDESDLVQQELSSPKFLVDRKEELAMAEAEQMSLLTEIFSITILLSAIGAVVIVVVSFKLLFALESIAKAPGQN